MTKPLPLPTQKLEVEWPAYLVGLQNGQIFISRRTRMLEALWNRVGEARPCVCESLRFSAEEGGEFDAHRTDVVNYLLTRCTIGPKPLYEVTDPYITIVFRGVVSKENKQSYNLREYKPNIHADMEYVGEVPSLLSDRFLNKLCDWNDEECRVIVSKVSEENTLTISEQTTLRQAAHKLAQTVQHHRTELEAYLNGSTGAAIAATHGCVEATITNRLGGAYREIAKRTALEQTPAQLELEHDLIKSFAMSWSHSWWRVPQAANKPGERPHIDRIGCWNRYRDYLHRLFPRGSNECKFLDYVTAESLEDVVARYGLPETKSRLIGLHDASRIYFKQAYDPPAQR